MDKSNSINRLLHEKVYFGNGCTVQEDYRNGDKYMNPEIEIAENCFYYDPKLKVSDYYQFE